MNRVRVFFLGVCFLFSGAALKAEPIVAQSIWGDAIPSVDEGGEDLLTSVQEDRITGPDAYEEDDQWEQGRLMELGGLQQRNFYDDGVDWVKFNLEKGVKYRIETDVSGDCDTRIQLVINYANVAENDNKSSSDKGSKIVFHSKTDTNAYLKIMSRNGKIGEGNAYEIFFVKDGEGKPEKAKNWTSLLYMDATHQEGDAHVQDLLEIASVGAHPLYHVALLLNTKVGAGYYILEDKKLVLKQGFGPLNMGNPAVGKAFLDWAVRNCPARQYMFTFYGEGMGADRGIFPEYPGNDYLTEQEQAEILQHGVSRIGRKFGVIGYDMGLMASGELFYQLRNVAEYVAASEQTVLVQHWNYEVLDAMKDPALTPRDFIRHIVMCFEDTYGAWTDLTISAVDCSKSLAFARALDEFAKAALTSGINGQVFGDLIHNLPAFGKGQTRDLIGLLRRVESAAGIPQGVKEKAASLVSVMLNEYISMSWHGENWKNRAFGVSMVMKSDTENYRKYELCKDTKWNEFCDFAKFPAN